MQVNKPIANFFSGIQVDFILNTLYVLLFMLKIPQHSKRLKEILLITNPTMSIDGLINIVKEEIEACEEAVASTPQLLMRHITTGASAINVIQNTPVVWCFISLYWGYGFRDLDKVSIRRVYDWRIGDIALKFLLYFLKMKQKEISAPERSTHDDSFYTDLFARVVRIIDVLSTMSRQHSPFLKQLYFPEGNNDLALNFLKVQITFPWCSEALAVVRDKETNKNVIQYSNDDENIHFYIIPSRMAKEGILNNLDKTYRHSMELLNLDDANKKSKYSLVRKNKGVSSTVKKMKTPMPLVDDFTSELIYDTVPSSSSLDFEEAEEVRSHVRTYRRDTSVTNIYNERESEHKDKEEKIPNAYVQHRHNKAFSSSMCKDRLNLKSTYDTPLLQHLKSFIKFLGDSHA